MRKFVASMPLILALQASAAFACEFPEDESQFLATMNEERSLTIEALRKADLVVVGRVIEIRHGPVKNDRAQRTSEVKVDVKEVLFGGVKVPEKITLGARLHKVVVPCFANEAFWDDQVELDTDYIIFSADSAIISASSANKSWHELGLSGQREVVMSELGKRD